MTNWVIVTGRPANFDRGQRGPQVVPVRAYLAKPEMLAGAKPNIINLCRSYSYQSRGYYASLLAAARGHKVLPSVETIVDLSSRSLYSNAIPELESALNKVAAPHAAPLSPLLIAFGQCENPDLDRFARQLFDWFRAPALKVTITPGKWLQIKKIEFANHTRFTDAERQFFHKAMERFCSRSWRDKKLRTPSRYTFATLCNPSEELAPSSISSLKHWARIAQKMGADVEPINRGDLARLANFDALFIRETTTPANHTYRFARRAEQEGMPVIDDSASMLRCTNKVFLNEILTANGISVPPTMILAGPEDRAAAEERLSFPLVVKIPDSSFSRGVFKVSDAPEFSALTEKLFRQSDLLLAQKFMPTEFDWRIGILGGQPLFASQYLMARKHWQIVRHREGRKPVEGGFRAVSLADTPPQVIETAMRAAATIGSGLYGVDLKETSSGVHVVEINDNPNIEHGIEDAAEKDEVWRRLTQWFIDRLERR